MLILLNYQVNNMLSNQINFILVYIESWGYKESRVLHNIKSTWSWQFM